MRALILVQWRPEFKTFMHVKAFQHFPYISMHRLQALQPEKEGTKTNASKYAVPYMYIRGTRVGSEFRNRVNIQAQRDHAKAHPN